ncbi:MAG: hypothetical protein KF715_18475 [Candidatus Didemnitutus sp.]|nr:hypothetical protein [Candidatus Didemnitutus sp.]
MSPYPLTTDMGLSFRERYCSLHGINIAEFEEHLLPRALYFHARPFRGMLAALPDYFAADREFLRSVGDLRSRRFFHAEAGEYHTASGCRGVLHRLLRLRVSAERVRLIMEETWGTADSHPPVDSPDVSGR